MPILDSNSNFRNLLNLDIHNFDLVPYKLSLDMMCLLVIEDKVRAREEDLIDRSVCLLTVLILILIGCEAPQN